MSSELARNRVVVVAGFRGLNRSDDITTLGRGGSDTSAVRCRCAARGPLPDLPTSRGRLHRRPAQDTRGNQAQRRSRLMRCSSWRPLGAQVLNNRSVESWPKKYNVSWRSASSINPVPGNRC